MEILQLIYFQHAAQTQNFSDTAKHFHVPASNISQSIKRLETELNTKLFDRNANRVFLNPTGLEFCKKVHLALELLNEAKETAQAQTQPTTIRLCILVHRRITMLAIEKFQELYPNVQFITTHSITSNLSEYDIVVTDKELDGIYHKQAALEENFVLAYNPCHFSFTDPPATEELKDCPFITMNSGSSIFENTQKICNSFGFSPQIVLQSDDPFYIRKCIELGLGISILPAVSWQGLFAENVSFMPICDHKRLIYVYMKPHRNEQINAFFSILLSQFHS